MRGGSDDLLPRQKVVGLRHPPPSDQLHDTIGDRRHHVRGQHNSSVRPFRLEGDDPVDSSGPLERLGHLVGALLLDGEAKPQHQEPGSLNSISRITFAGAPAAITPGARSWVITEFAPITQRSPICTPPVTTQPTPNQQLDPIRTGPWGSNPCQVIGLGRSSWRCTESPTKQ